MSANFIPPKPSRPDGIVRVISLGRKSKPNPANENESIEASMEDAESYLGRMYKGPVQILRLGEQISGMIVDRATLRQVQDLMEAKEVDIVLTEDIGRVFRNPRHMYAFVQDCVDAEVRLIAVADNLDTADPNWETALALAAVRHGFAVPDARRRVSRSAIFSFRKGGNVQRIRFGYRKLTKEEAQSGTFGPVGLRITKRLELTRTIQEICAKVKDIANYRSYDDIADFLETSGIPPGPYCRCGHWNGKLVVNLVRDDILMGVRSFGKTKGRRNFKSGKIKHGRNDDGPEKICYQELAHLTPEEYRELEQYVAFRAARQVVKKGREHPRYNVPRHKAIFPGQHMRCWLCGAIFYACDKGGQFKCRRAFKRSRTKCWCHVQVDAKLARKRVLEWILCQLDEFPGFRDRLIDAAWEEFARIRSRRSSSVGMWTERVGTLERVAAKLARAIRLTDESEALIVEMKEVNLQLAKAKRERDACVQTEESAGTFLNRDDVEQRLPQALLDSASTSFQFADFLRSILVRFDICPVQAIDSGLVRPRAFVTLEIAVPATGEQNESVQQIEGVIDLFDPPDFIKHLNRCVEARKRVAPGQRRPTYEQLAESLGIHHMTIKRAIALSRKMEQEGLSEPYRLLREPPAQASRWRSRCANAPAAALSVSQLPLAQREETAGLERTNDLNTIHPHNPLGEIPTRSN